MPFDFRKAMIDKMLTVGWGLQKPTPEQVESMRRYYERMDDERVFFEYTNAIKTETEDDCMRHQ